MKFHFYVRFSTHVGQSLQISGSLPELGSGNEDAALPLQYLNDQFWFLNLELPDSGENKPGEFSYRYILSEDGQERVSEWGNDRLVETDKLN